MFNKIRRITSLSYFFLKHEPSDYIKQHNLEKIDILKLDIEGTEFGVVRDIECIPDRIQLIIGKLHKAFVNQDEFYAVKGLGIFVKSILLTRRRIKSMSSRHLDENTRPFRLSVVTFFPA